MRKGDRAFFYHSNCKEPGVVGVMRIVKEFSPDCEPATRRRQEIFSLTRPRERMYQ